MSQSDPPADEATADTTTRQRPSDPPPRPRRVTKRKDDAVIDGVCSGIGTYFGIDPVLVRLGFVAAVFAGGAGIIAYIVCMVVIPDDPGDGTAPTTEPASRRSPQFWVGVGLIVFAIVILADRFDFFDPGLVWPVVLIGIGVALWTTSERRNSTRPDAPSDAPPPDAFAGSPAPPPPPEPWAAPSTTREQSITAGLSWEPDNTPSSKRSPVGRVTVAIALVTTGVLVAIDSAGALAVSVPEMLAVALMIVGGGLLVATRWGRARGLLSVGILLLLVVVASGFATRLDVPLAAGIGERLERPASVAELEDAYELSIGHLVVDLTALDLDGGTVTTGVHLGIGQIEVWVPDDVDVIVDARAGAGQLELFGTEYVGGTFVDRRLEDAGEDGGTLELDVSTGLGQVVVERDVRADTGLDGAAPAVTERWGAADRQGPETTATAGAGPREGQR